MPALPFRRIMVVDDDERIAEEITRALKEQETYQVFAYVSGQAAREALDDSYFDLLIADWKMPDVDGLALIQQAQERSPDTITVLMSAYGNPMVDNGNATPFVHHFIQKPFEIDELLNVITSIFPQTVIEDVQTKPLVLKVVLGGDAQVGKTSLIHRYCTGHFDPLRTMTIGVDFHLYDFQVDQTKTRLVVWDMGGQERFAYARRAFYRGTQAVGLVFDASNRTSFYNLMHWWREAREFLPDVPMLLLANKTDLERQVTSQDAGQLAQAWSIPLFEASCASGQGVSEFFHALATVAVHSTQNKNAEMTK
jgi:small GTP-binding protein